MRVVVSTTALNFDFRPSTASELSARGWGLGRGRAQVMPDAERGEARREVDAGDEGDEGDERAGRGGGRQDPQGLEERRFDVALGVDVAFGVVGGVPLDDARGVEPLLARAQRICSEVYKLPIARCHHQFHERADLCRK
jgi:hypothetical protein